MSDTEEIYLEPEPIMEQYNHPSSEDDGDDDETLSFSDLPIYSSSSSNSSEDDSRNSGRYRQEEEEEDSFFEFSSDDFTAAAYPAKNIIFCGKIIPHKYPSESEFPSNAAAEDTSADYETFGELYRCSRSPVPLEPQKYKSRARISPNKKVSVLTASPSKSKWMLSMFGFAKLPYSEMELNGMKSSRQRQGASRRIPAPLKEVGKRSSQNGKGCWEMIKVGLGCSSIHADAVVNASFVRMTHQ